MSSDITTKRVDALEEQVNDDYISEGTPDVGSESRLNVEDYREAFITGALETLVNLPVGYYDEDEHETHPMDVTAPENVARLYFMHTPWQAPIVVLEVENLPEYAKVTTTESVWMRPIASQPAKETWARFQIREARN